jgi:ribosomal protein S18 acetylase RimI-like enzyme
MALAYEARGKGIGTQLLRALMSLAQKQRHKQISLCVDPPNTGALRFYKRLGFQEVGSHDPIKMVADLTVPIPDPAAGN